MPVKYPNTLIIDGHGATADWSFDFCRSEETKCQLYSYVREGKLADAEYSNKLIMEAVKTSKVPDGYCELNASRIGGTKVRDRILQAQKLDWDENEERWKPQWNYQLPSDWGADIVKLDAFDGGKAEGKAELVVWYSGDKMHESDRVWMTLKAETNDDSKSVLLSTILNFFNKQSYDVLWMVCR